MAQMGFFGLVGFGSQREQPPLGSAALGSPQGSVQASELPPASCLLASLCTAVGAFLGCLGSGAGEAGLRGHRIRPLPLWRAAGQMQQACVGASGCFPQACSPPRVGATGWPELMSSGSSKGGRRAGLSKPCAHPERQRAGLESSSPLRAAG